MQVSANQSAPDDLVIVGYVSGAFGLQGWVKIRPYSTTADALLEAPLFWLESAAQAGVAPNLREVKRLSSKIHGEDVVARLDEVPDRTAAEALKGTVVKVSRQAFPAHGGQRATALGAESLDQLPVDRSDALIARRQVRHRGKDRLVLLERVHHADQRVPQVVGLCHGGVAEPGDGVGSVRECSGSRSWKSVSAATTATRGAAAVLALLLPDM